MHLISNFSGHQTPSGFPRAPTTRSKYNRSTPHFPNLQKLSLIIRSFTAVSSTLVRWSYLWAEVQLLYCIAPAERAVSKMNCPVGWGCRIHWLHLCRGVRLPPNECPDYDTKQSDGEVPAMLELWGMRSTPSLPSLPGPL